MLHLALLLQQFIGYELLPIILKQSLSWQVYNEKTELPELSSWVSLTVRWEGRIQEKVSISPFPGQLLWRCLEVLLYRHQGCHGSPTDLLSPWTLVLSWGCSSTLPLAGSLLITGLEREVKFSRWDSYFSYAAVLWETLKTSIDTSLTEETWDLELHASNWVSVRRLRKKSKEVSPISFDTLPSVEYSSLSGTTLWISNLAVCFIFTLFCFCSSVSLLLSTPLVKMRKIHLTFTSHC